MTGDPTDNNGAGSSARPRATDGWGAVPSLHLESFLPYRLSVLANTVSYALAELYRERFELSIPDWRVLAVLARFPDSSAGELIQHTRMDKVAISRSVARLLERSLIRRETSAQDRRRSELRLSDEGRAVYAEIVPLAKACESRLLESLPAEQRRELDALLLALQAAAESLTESLGN